MTSAPASTPAELETIEADSTPIGEIVALAVEATSKVPTVTANGFKKLFFMANAPYFTNEKFR